MPPNSKSPLIRRSNSHGDDDAVSVGSVGNGTTKRRNGGIIVNRVFIFIVLALVVAASVFFQNNETELLAQIQHDEEAIAQLKSVVQSQADVIERFNQSVSNSDVLIQLHAIQDQINRTTKDINEKLDFTRGQVDLKLNQTLLVLSDTVKKAEDEINNEVSTVKKDFEQYVVTTQDQFSMENDFMVYQLAGTFTLLSCLISMWHMSAHLRSFNQPVIQRKILAILWMSPIYAITSWFSLVFHSAEGTLAIIKDAYEAYIIYQFLSFCIAVLGKGDRQTVINLLAKRADHLTPPFHLFPWCCSQDYENDHALARAILLQCQTFAMQFVFLRPLSTIANVLLKHYQYYGPWAESAADYRAPQVYIALIQNLSVFMAFTGLLKFYHAVDQDLEWCRPFAKFLCIKGVVFMTFWQGLVLTILAQTTDMGGQDSDEWALSAQNFLICLEMLCFSIAHFYCFPVEEWEDTYRSRMEQQKRNAKLGDSIALGDFVSDLKMILRGSAKKKKKKTKKMEPVAEGDNEDEDAEDGGSGDCDRADCMGDLKGDVEWQNQSGYDSAGTDDGDDEDEDDDGSDVSGLTSESYSLGTETQNEISKALVRNLGKTGDSKLMEARERILQSELFDSEGRIDGSDTESPPRSPPSVVDAHEPIATNDDSAPDVANESSEGPRENKDDGEQPSERTGLLSGSTPVLRPSFFTSLSKDIEG